MAIHASGTLNAIRMHPGDTVAVLVEDVKAGEPVRLLGGEAIHVVLVQDIPYGHKVAIEAMKAGEAVVKYGERMGIATADIGVGSHVHVHNVRGLEPQERGVRRDVAV